MGKLVELANQAGHDILSFYGTDFFVDEKSDASPLTAADLSSHHRLISGLQVLTPDVPILSEESVAVDVAERLSWNTYWLIDPLDGTKEFLKRNGEFTVNIALIHHHTAILGVVSAPALGTTYFGQLGQGAYHRNDQGHVTSVRTTAPCPSPLRVVGSRSHPSPDLDGYLLEFAPTQMVTVGSSLKFCRIAEGYADLYPRFGPTSEWDTAAGQAVLEAAGGHVIDLNGHPLRYNLKSSLCNPYFIAFGDASKEWLPLR